METKPTNLVGFAVVELTFPLSFPRPCVALALAVAQGGNPVSLLFCENFWFPHQVRDDIAISIFLRLFFEQYRASKGHQKESTQ